MREDLHIEEGDLLEAVVEGDSVVLTPKAAVDKRLNAYLTERLEELRAETWWVGNTALCAGQNTSICNSYHTLFIRFPPAVSDKFFASEGKQYKL